MTQEESKQQDYRIEGSAPLRGTFVVPGDKSISHRALMLGAIAHGETRIKGLLEGADCLSTAKALRQLGSDISVDTIDGVREWRVGGVSKQSLKASSDNLDLGNSGTGMRLMAGLLAGQSIDATLIGDASLMSRPMERIANPLRQMGVIVSTEDGNPPLKISTAGVMLKGLEFDSPIASAQVKSAILLAGLGASGSTIVSEPVRSRDHTERMLRAFGCPVDIDGRCVSIRGGAKLHGIDLDVPGDISSAAFLMVAASIIPGSDITLRNVGINSTRIGIVKILEAMGANIESFDKREIHQESVCDFRIRSTQLRGIDIPADWVPSAIDEFPIVFIAAAVAKGTTRVVGAEELKVKESDRLGAMAAGLKSLGATVVETYDGLEITGGCLRGGEIESYDDHRIAMAFAIAGGVASEAVIVRDVSNVQTSFPKFAQITQTAGLNLETLA